MKYFINKLDGLLLGDGCIGKKVYRQYIYNKEDIYYYRYTQCCIYRCWLENISDWLLDEGSFKSDIYKLKGNKYSLQSKSSRFFVEQRYRWYEDYYYEDRDMVVAIKIVPKDIDLTSECVANWYMGDGYISKRKFKNSYLIGLATEGFTKDEVEYLVCLLNEQVINGFYLSKSGVKKTGEQSYKIQLTKRQNIKEFIEYIRPYVVSCFDYKIPEVV